jgi:FAD/FMN-containing dehydrogenase
MASCSAGSSEDTPFSELNVDQKNIINDITGLNPIKVARVIEPRTVGEIVSALSGSTGQVSIGGGRYSQGGQIAYPDSLHIDMRQLKRVLEFSPEKKEIKVEAGMTWRGIQQVIDPLNLSVQIMQSYANFTVGGSLSVNVHGRYVGKGPIISSVKSFRLVLADGNVIDASRETNTEVFYGAIGGYGALGVIVEATLLLDDNVKIQQQRETMNVKDYRGYFQQSIRNKKDVVFHNANIYPPDYEDVSAVSWVTTDLPLTHDERLVPEDRHYLWEPRLAEFIAAGNIGKWLRKHVFEPLYYAKERVVWRNWEASHDARELEPSSREKATFALREYFVPVERFEDFHPKMREILQKHHVNVLNVSVRHAHPDPGSLLAWAKSEVFALVVYYQQETDEAAKEVVRTWTVEMVDAALSVGGSYYLPYQVYNTREQFLQAYPRAKEFFALKAKLDPNKRFVNQLLAAYE